MINRFIFFKNLCWFDEQQRILGFKFINLTNIIDLLGKDFVNTLDINYYDFAMSNLFWFLGKSCFRLVNGTTTHPKI